MTKPAFIPRIVPADDQPALDQEAYAYEHEQRRKIRERNYASVHIRGDRSPPLDLPTRVARGWRG